MCSLCGGYGFETGAFGIAERPAQTLRGIRWRGDHSDAAAGGIAAALREVQGWARPALGPWGGPIVGIALEDAGDRLHYFVGVAGDAGSPLPPARGLEELVLEGRRYATAWHAHADGDVVSHYGRMLEWIGAVGHDRASGPVRQREEYPLDADFAGASELRLMIPIA